MFASFKWVTISSLLLSPVATLANPQPVIQELLKASQTLGEQTVTYPKGTPEMRLYRVTLAPGAKIPLHIHPSPVMVYVQEGTLTNVRIVNGQEVINTIQPESGFLEGSRNEPHYVVNNGEKPAVSIVTFASVVGMPNLIKVE